MKNKDREYYKEKLEAISDEKMEQAFNDKNELSLTEKIDLAEEYNYLNIIYSIWWFLPKMAAIINALDSNKVCEALYLIEYIQPWPGKDIKEKLSYSEFQRFFEEVTYGTGGSNLEEWKAFYNAWKDMKMPPRPR